jgi:hypothetical protein
LFELWSSTILFLNLPVGCILYFVFVLFWYFIFVEQRQDQGK